MLNTVTCYNFSTVSITLRCISLLVDRALKTRYFTYDCELIRESIRIGPSVTVVKASTGVNISGLLHSYLENKQTIIQAPNITNWAQDNTNSGSSALIALTASWNANTVMLRSMGCCC